MFQGLRPGKQAALPDPSELGSYHKDTTKVILEGESRIVYDGGTKGFHKLVGYWEGRYRRSKKVNSIVYDTSVGTFSTLAN